MSLEFLDFAAIKPIIDQARTVQQEVLQTENMLKEISTALASVNLTRTNAKKLVADVRAQIAKGKTLEQIFFKSTNGLVSISPKQVNQSLDTSIRELISTAITKEITASVIEPTKRKQVQTIGATLKQHGIAKPIFDKIITLAGMTFAQNYLLTMEDNFLIKVSEASLDGGGVIQTVQPSSVVYLEGGEQFINPFLLSSIIVVVPTALSLEEIIQNKFGMKVKIEAYNDSQELQGILYMNSFIVSPPPPASQEVNDILEGIELPESSSAQTTLYFQFTFPSFVHVQNFSNIKIYADSFIDLYTSDNKKIVANKTELLATVTKQHLESIGIEFNNTPPLA